VSRSLKLVVLTAAVVLLAGGFWWRFGDTTAPPAKGSEAAQQITTGWRRIDNVPLDRLAAKLPGIRQAPEGIPASGTYLVNFWSSTCGPCRYEMPWLQRFSTTSKVRVLGVTRDNLLHAAESQLDRAKVTYPNVRDEYGDFAYAMAKVVPPQYLPSTIIVRDGKVVWAHVGPFRSYADLVASVTKRIA
jgi:thiol-disulfide isomerase/thioredoxin